MGSLDSYVSAVLERTNLGEQYPTIGQKLQTLYMEHEEELDLIEPFTVSFYSCCGHVSLSGRIHLLD